MDQGNTITIVYLIIDITTKYFGREEPLIVCDETNNKALHIKAIRVS